MAFVENIGYATDASTTGQEEYWKFPIETLYAQGDCEDLAMLAMSLFLAVLNDVEGEGITTALFIFWNVHNTGSGHAMAAIYMGNNIPHPPQDAENTKTGWYTAPDGKTYYACETTDVGWQVGEMPPLLSGQKPDIIIEISS
jgi:hypothetical protein